MQGAECVRVRGRAAASLCWGEGCHARATHLAARVECVEDPAITAEGPDMRHKVHVAVHLTDGSVLEDTVETARGSEAHFGSDEEIRDKFRLLARKTLPDAQIERLADAVLHLDDLDDAGEIARLLVTA